MNQAHTYAVRLRRLILPITCIVVFFAGVVVCAIVYMAKDNNYYNTIYRYFGISPRLHIRLMYLGVSKKLLSYGMNLFSAGFIGGNLIFGCLFHDHFRYTKGWRFYGLLMLPLVLEFLLYSPDIYYFVYSGGLGFLPDPGGFRLFYRQLHNITILLNLCYLVAAWLMVVTTDEKQYPVKQLRTVKWVVIFGHLLINALYFMLFYDLPQSLIWVSRVARYMHFQSLRLGPYNLLMYLSPYLILLFLTVLTAALVSYYRTMRGIDRNTSAFSNKVASAEISSRAFSHYIKNELVAILAEIDYIREDVPGRIDHLDVIERECRDIFGRLDQLQRHSNSIILNQSLVDIRQVVQDALEHLAHRFEESGVQVELQDGTTGPVPVFCDTHYLHEVFVNLLINAVEAMNANGEKPRLITVSIQTRTDHRVEILIADTGPGFRRELLDTVFEPFVSTKSTKYNWGVGLSFSRRIVNSHNGEILADNAPGGGARIRMALPVVVRQQPNRALNGRGAVHWLSRWRGRTNADHNAGED